MSGAWCPCFQSWQPTNEAGTCVAGGCNLSWTDQIHDPSGMDEYHPDTSHNPGGNP